jgi:cytochrome c-type biogenesis protein CcmH
MTNFIILSTVMMMLALMLVGWPLVRNVGKADGNKTVNVIAGLLVMLLIPMAATYLYSRISTWDWENTATAPGTAANHSQGAGDMGAMIDKLRARLDSEGGAPGDWVLLGRSYLRAGDSESAMSAFDKAMSLGGDQDPAVLVQLGQALVEMDESTLAGSAGELFEKALSLSPKDPGALWWSGYSALATGRGAEAKARWTQLLELNPPENIAKILNEQIARIDGVPMQQDVAAQSTAARTPAQAKTVAASNTSAVSHDETVPAGTVALHVSVDPALDLSGLNGPTVVFIIARPAGAMGGPPLAAVRRSTSDLPATILLSDENAMMAGTSLTGVEELQLTARISFGGGPGAAPGDLYGQINYRWTDGNAANLVINSVVK